MKRQTYILGGGTFQPIRNHLALCAPAFGTTARKIKELMPEAGFILTKMAAPESNLVTNEDVEGFIDSLLISDNIGTIILNVAFCDYKALPIDGIESGIHAERLKTSEGNITIELTPTEKIIAKIRKARPDIFLVGFKTTTGKTSEEQFSIALKTMKSVKCNLMFANDVITRNNMIITAEESIYGETTDREKALQELVDITRLRQDLTYNKSEFIQEFSFSIKKNTPLSFQTVIQFLIDNGGFIENNSNGFTPGHFCYKTSHSTFLSSQRKANHNLVFTEGMSEVSVVWNHLDLTKAEYAEETEPTFVVRGMRKASVGARSQWLMLKENQDYDCIIHTHNPLKEGSLIPVAEQRPWQCGSRECGVNTVTHLKSFGSNIRAVYLEKHGTNILFKSSQDPNEVIEFIKVNLELGTKVK